ncbi:Retrovirus-related Pol polyprotein from transposon TNT 1-94 [Symbiodinium microadriaticum]|uniref:Retrovirus-related Pol polyprotein from transposon TNT 1-94 n=1 Tax=Symbiodinium microadriaticum TaxID=2951 RepID=A0A1Q9CVV1_SYMMI|nr:Retrovirus-related Pol polyprotein from transposon TNT 1-94 [Symbiodinium microadriaticum]
MPTSTVTKKEMQDRLRQQGENPPTSWTKVQLAARLAELAEEITPTTSTMTERDVVKMINRCKRKAELQALLQEHGVPFAPAQTIDQLKSKIYKHLMETQVIPSGPENMGFGKHSEMTYNQVIVEKPEYTKWCISTAVENPESHWRLLRFAQWAQGISMSEKEAIRGRLGTSWTTAYPVRAAAAKRIAAPSGASGSETSWEMTQEVNQDLEMIPEEAMSRIKELELELGRLRQEMKNREGNHEVKTHQKRWGLVSSDGALIQNLSLQCDGRHAMERNPMNSQASDQAYTSEFARRLVRYLQRKESWFEVAREFQSSSHTCFAASSASPESTETPSEGIQDIPRETRKRIFQNLRKIHTATGDLVYVWRRMKTFELGTSCGYIVGVNFSRTQQPLSSSDYLEECGVSFPGEESEYWKASDSAVALSLELPGLKTRKGKEWARDLGCYFVKQLRRNAVEVSEKRLTEAEREAFKGAKQKEVKNFVVAKAFQKLPEHLRPSKGQVLKMRWLLTWKVDDDHKDGEPVKRDAVGNPLKPKARAVVLGYMDPEYEHRPTSSPTMARTTRQLFLQQCANHKFTVEKGDISGAFLQGDNFGPERPMVCEPLPEICEALGVPQGSEMLLTTYGLVEAPIQWYLTVARFLESIGGERQFSDPTCWGFFRADRTPIGWVCGHVDDFLFGGDSKDPAWQKIRKLIQERFKWGQWESGKFTQCGVVIEQDSEGFSLSQPDYLEAVSEIHVSNARWQQPESPIDGLELQQLRSVLGALSWHASQVAPQWCAPVSLLMSKIHTGVVNDILETNKLLRKAKLGQHQKMRIHGQGHELPLLAAWVDAADGHRPDGGSTKGIVIGWAPRRLLDGALVRISPLFWQSAKIQRTCRSSGAAETHAAVDADDELYAVRPLSNTVFQLSAVMESISLYLSQNLKPEQKPSQAPKVEVDYVGFREEDHHVVSREQEVACLAGILYAAFVLASVVHFGQNGAQIGKKPWSNMVCIASEKEVLSACDFAWDPSLVQYDIWSDASTTKSHEKAITELKQDGDSEDGDSDLKARKLKSENLVTPPKDHAIIMYKNANTVDDDMPVDDDVGKKHVPKSRKGRRKANKFRRVRQAVMNAKKNALTKPKKSDTASAPTSKPKRTAGADEVKPGSYAPGKFRDARLDFIRRQMREQGLSWKEACKLWLPSAERASFLQGMSKSELSKRRFNV